MYKCVCVWPKRRQQQQHTILTCHPLPRPPLLGFQLSLRTAQHSRAHDTLYESESSPSSWSLSLSFASCPTGCHSHAYFTRRCPPASLHSLLARSLAALNVSVSHARSHIPIIFSHANSYAYSFLHAARTNRIMGRGDDDDVAATATAIATTAAA